MSEPTLHVEIFSDIVCPWCSIGKARFDRAVALLVADGTLAASREDATAQRPFVEVAIRPFQLDPTAPRDRAEPVLETYARKFGGPERAAQLTAQVTELAAAEGIEFRMDRAVRANTADAHRLLWWVLWQHGPDVQLTLNASLMDAYFREGLNVADYDVLADRAAAVGLDRETVRAFLDTEQGVEAVAVGLERAAELGVTAVPTFVIEQRWSVPGAQDPDVFVNALRRLIERR